MILEICVEVRSTMTEDQYRAIEDLLARPLGRFKGWPDHYVFTLEPEHFHREKPLTDYLRRQRLPYDCTRTTRWEP